MSWSRRAPAAKKHVWQWRVLCACQSCRRSVMHAAMVHSILCLSVLQAVYNACCPYTPAGLLLTWDHPSALPCAVLQLAACRRAVLLRRLPQGCDGCRRAGSCRPAPEAAPAVQPLVTDQRAAQRRTAVLYHWEQVLAAGGRQQGQRYSWGWIHLPIPPLTTSARLSVTRMSLAHLALACLPTPSLAHFSLACLPRATSGPGARRRPAPARCDASHLGPSGSGQAEPLVLLAAAGGLHQGTQQASAGAGGCALGCAAGTA